MSIRSRIVRGLLPAVLCFTALRLSAEPLYILPESRGRLVSSGGKKIRKFKIVLRETPENRTTEKIKSPSPGLSAAFPRLSYREAGQRAVKKNQGTLPVYGPVLRLDRGDDAEVDFLNTLREPSSVHWHGIENVPSAADGVFRQIPAGGRLSVRFHVDQIPSTAWYHPHVHGRATEQVYRGLSGVVLIDDPGNPRTRELPRSYGVDDFVLILSDKRVAEDAGSPGKTEVVFRPEYHDYIMRGYTGNDILTNWQKNPELELPRGLIRFRILNASTAEFLTLSLGGGQSFYLLASDGGLLPGPLKTKSVFLSAGSRREILVDTRKRSSFSLEAEPGERNTGGFFQKFRKKQSVLRLRVKKQRAPVRKLPRSGGVPWPVPPDHYAASRNFVLSGGSAMSMMSNKPEGESAPFLINNRGFSAGRIDTAARAGTWEKWTLTSRRGHHAFDHSFHVHGRSVLILSVNGKKPPAEDREVWQDVVYIRPGDKVELAVPITSEKGMFVYHCHILEHEDVGMMGILKTE